MIKQIGYNALFLIHSIGYVVITIKNAIISDEAIISFLGTKTFTETFGCLFSELELNNYLDDTFKANKVKKN
jgi:hypothetical protein